MPRTYVWLVCAVVGLHIVLLAIGASVHSPSWDEVGHLPSGMVHWEFADFRAYRVNPPLVRMVAALPLLISGVKVGPSPGDGGPLSRPEWQLAKELTESSGRQLFGYFRSARWACIPFSLLGAWVCFRWASELYGATSGLLALGLWCFGPSILANGQMLTPDTGAAALGACALYLFWLWLREPSWSQSFVTGLVLGLAQLTKFTWVVLFGLWPALWLMWRWSQARKAVRTSAEALQVRSPTPWNRRSWYHQGSQLLLMLVLAVYVINVGYVFEDVGRRLRDFRFVSQAFKRAPSDDPLADAPEAGNRFADWRLGALPLPLPANYVLGIDGQKREFEMRYWSYLRGEWRQQGWWYYYLYGLTIKEPLGTWLLGFLALRVTARAAWRQYRRRRERASAQGHRLLDGGDPSLLCETTPGVATPAPSAIRSGDESGRRCSENGTGSDRPDRSQSRSGTRADRHVSWRDELLLWAPIVTVLVLVSSQTGFNHHLRYVLPIYPFAFIWISKVAVLWERGWRELCLLRRVLRIVRQQPENGWVRGVFFPGESRSLTRRAPVRIGLGALVGGALAWSVGSSLYYFPHSHAYFNELVGGPLHGHEHLLDSNIDWGQDLLPFKRWLEKHPEVKPIGLAYSLPPSLLDPADVGIEYLRVPPGPPGAVVDRPYEPLGPLPGWYAIFVRAMREHHDRYRYFEHFEPVEILGYTVRIYHITREQANRVRRELGLAEIGDVEDAARMGAAVDLTRCTGSELIFYE